MFISLKPMMNKAALMMTSQGSGKPLDGLKNEKEWQGLSIVRKHGVRGKGLTWHAIRTVLIVTILIEEIWSQKLKLDLMRDHKSDTRSDITTTWQ